MTDLFDSISAELADADNFSAYPNLKGQTVEWISDDAEHMYDRNLKNYSQKLLATGISRDDITYQINSNGFRSKEFTSGDWLAAVGCSFTFGVGLPLEHTWSHIIADKLGLECANLGKPGGSPDTCFRMCYYWLPILKPKFLIYLEPPPARFELLDGRVKVDKDCGLYYANIATVSEKKYNMYVEWSRNFLNFELNYRKNKLAIQSICDSLDIQMLSYKVYDDLEVDELARDLRHSGIQANHKFAEKVYNSHF